MVTTSTLILSDNSVSANAFKEYFENNAFLVIGVARTGKEAMDYLAAVRPDVILIDMKFGGEFLWRETVTKLCELDIPLLFIMARDVGMCNRKLKKDVAFVRKPSEPSTILTEINNMLVGLPGGAV